MTKKQLEVAHKDISEQLNLADKEVTRLQKIISAGKSKIKVDVKGLQDAINQYQNDMSELENNIISRDIVIESLTFDIEKLGDKLEYSNRVGASRLKHLVSAQTAYNNLRTFRKFFFPTSVEEALIHTNK